MTTAISRKQAFGTSVPPISDPEIQTALNEGNGADWMAARLLAQEAAR